MRKPQTMEAIFEYLLNHPEKTKVGYQLGYFALGDACSIAENSYYKDELVLVEFRFGRFTISQYNHWGYRTNKDGFLSQPTVFDNTPGKDWERPQEKQLNRQLIAEGLI